jgi:hypothetical protein
MLYTYYSATVVDLADHISRLREAAVTFRNAFDTRERGFFSPSEDEQVLHLWVSYHKSRNALLDLIDTIRRSVGQASDEYLEEFAVAYGATLVLVDAARTLRDLFGEDTLVRRKLNESYAPYGIEEGSFDAIQMSLTDPTNALRIRQATGFYDDFRESLSTLAQNDERLGEVLTVIDSLSDSARVGTSRYVKARALERSRDMRDRVVGSVSRTVYAIQELGSRLVSNVSTMPNHVPKLPDEIAAGLLEMLQAGDVLVTRKDCALTNYFLPGYWPHAAMYVGGQRVIESLKDGVRDRSMDSPFGNDAVAVIRPQLDPVTIENAIERARSHVGKPYDFDFDFTRGDRVVCTEVVYRSYEGLGGIRFQMTRRAGRETVSAEDLLNLAIGRQFFDQVAVYCPEHSSELLVDDEMTSVLRKTMAEPAL